MEAARGRAENGLRARYAAGQDRGEETLGSGRAGYSSGIDGVHQAPPLEWARGKGTASERSEDARKPSTLSTSHSSAAADGDTVDVLVVYPSFARELEGGYGPMLSLIDLDIATANEAYAASGVELRVELAAAVEVEYDWFLEAAVDSDDGYGEWASAMGHLFGRDDGYLDEVHVLRDRHAADLVLLHVGETLNTVQWSPVSGIALNVSDVSTEVLEKSGFSVAASGDGTVVAHELGHSMGLKHDRYQDTTNEPFPYSHGFRYEHSAARPELGPDEYYNPALFGTIMSQYSNRERKGFVLAFSNPDLVHPDDPDLRLGVPGDEPSSAPDGPANANQAPE